ncbi:DEAD/DEAH box helicase [Ornithinimicrobium tianjinense]|uniref:DNA helicase n=1 Tax=Ornithinimicrobium tianjinense TaxID=1195761 RepID=A0A917BIM1_9MICO|nr:DEAD/DEAH box helicase [Ornithinimicrobium tianjinense]GGF45519.1 DNA helicase [Ornithinimicrobium tianjinense]
MPTDLTAATWVLSLSQLALRAQVGAGALERGLEYAETGRVGTLVAAPSGTPLIGTVAGSARQSYTTIVHRTGDGPRDWQSRCTCPMGQDCKHVVAVILSVQQRLSGAPAGHPTGQPSWEKVLAPLLRVPAPGSAPGETGGGGLTPANEVRLGLLVGLEHLAWQRDRSLSVQLRPVRPGRGRQGGWVRSGVAWRDLSSRWSSPDVRADHRSALSQLHAVARGSDAHGYWSAEELSLGELGPVAWPLLRRCLALGIELVPGQGVTQVSLGEGGAVLTLDLSREEDGDLVLRQRLLAEPLPGPGQVLPLGRPAHGVAHLSEEGALTLWPLDHAPSDTVLSVLEGHGSLRVPAHEVGRFLALYYPVVARHVALSSADGSVPAAAGTRPVLHLRLTPEPGHGLGLAWSFRYAVPDSSGRGADHVLVALDDRTQPRDTAAEQETLDRVVPLLEHLPGLVERLPAGQTRPAPYPRLSLSGTRTARFVAEVLPVLREDEEVEVEVVGELPDYAEADEAPVVRLSTTRGEVDDWFDLHVRVTVGDQEVPFEDLFAALARGDEVLLLASGTWFTLDRPELQALRDLIAEARELQDAPPRDATVRLTPYQAGLWGELVRLGVVDAQDARWQDSVEALLSLGDADHGLVRQPESLRADLRPYQLEGYRWLSALWDAGLGGVLADDMGLGKTLQVLATVVRAEDRGDLADGPVLVVAPTSVVSGWVEQAQRFAPHLRIAAVAATRRRRGLDLAEAVGAADVVVTSYTLLRLEADDYARLPWGGLVLDEAQFVKNHRSATYQAVRRLAGPRSFVVTGTPLENNLMELWSMTSLAAPGLFPRPELFAQRYRRPIEAGGAPELLDRLRRRLRPFMLRRTKSEVASELPPKTEQTVHVALHPAHQRVYDKHLQRERQRVLGLLADLDKNRVAIFRSLTVLRQLALDPSLVSDEHHGLATSAKVTALMEQIVELAAEGHRALVFSSFTGFLSRVRAALEAAGVGYSYLDGSTPGEQRAQRIAAFREGQDPVFLISLKAGGVGLTLTEADYVFVLDPWWNPAAEAQAVDRTHRIGQTRPVNVYRMVSTGTIEEKVVGLQERKRRLFASVVDAGEFRSGQLTADDIRDLLEG